MLDCAVRGIGGIYNASSPPGHTTMGQLMAAGVEATGSSAELVWFAPEEIAAEELVPWTELPIWVPPDGEFTGFFGADVAAALDTGLRCRPIGETVTATWDWMTTEGAPPQRDDRPVHGIAPEREAAILERHPGPR
jgi:hypothetical protein